MRDLPAKELAVARDDDYRIDYEVIVGKQSTVLALRTAVNAADREGEAIAWHLEQLLGLRNAQRVEFHEITERAIYAAIAKPRKIDCAIVFRFRLFERDQA